ncbi:hypothetical protein BC936DRAFT_139967 [Jimgerdemannia flammicorona]|uniref:Uncharacterized protein n=1 Tax=Jimgerdemannia flammicorona TaxID=994334 RepID=A0A433DHA1_9FUNG|nr:hypothetical protein BC936DRAFT_139967 [Jimgerdemannia flammicorona]
MLRIHFLDPPLNEPLDSAIRLRDQIRWVMVLFEYACARFIALEAAVQSVPDDGAGLPSEGGSEGEVGKEVWNGTNGMSSLVSGNGGWDGGLSSANPPTRQPPTTQRHTPLFARNTTVPMSAIAKLLPIVYEVNITVALEIDEEFSAFMTSHADEMRSVTGFLRTVVYVRDPKGLEGDIDNRQPDRVHRYYTVLYEVAEKGSLDKWIGEEEPKITRDLQELTKGGADFVVVTSRKVLFPLSQYKVAK